MDAGDQKKAGAQDLIKKMTEFLGLLLEKFKKCKKYSDLKSMEKRLILDTIIAGIKRRLKIILAPL